MQATKLPTVYLTSTDAGTQGRNYVDSSKQNTTMAALKMIGANGKVIGATSIKELKARGNSTFTYAEKKSYQMKLETASDLLQNGENVKTWVLLANYFDATQMHDKLFKDLAAALDMPYTASCDWVNLYYDGEYNEATGKHYYDYVDKDSLVKIFLMQELALNPDGFISSLFFYKDAGEIMYAGPIWDQDMTLGTGWSKYVSPDTTDYHYLADALIQIPDFRAAVNSYYKQHFAPLAKALIEECGTIDGYEAFLKDSAKMNFVLWRYIRIGDPAVNGHIWQDATYAGVVADMQSWLTSRIAYLDNTFAEPVFELGDVNGDGVVDVFDVYSLRRYLAGYEVEKIILANGDVNGDGEVDIFDAWALQRRLAGYKD